MPQTTVPTTFLKPEEFPSKEQLTEKDVLMGFNETDGDFHIEFPYVANSIFNVNGRDASARNNVPGFRDLTDRYTEDDFAEMCGDNDFGDVGIGDFRTVEFTNPSGTLEVVDVPIVCFDYFLNCGSEEMTDHHMARIILDAFADTAQMNSSSTTAGGYAGSAMHTDVLPSYYTPLNQAMGGHILAHDRYLTTEVNTSANSAGGANLTGSATTAAWTATHLCLMSEPMMFGTTVFSSSGRDVAEACIQFPIFRMRPDLRRAYQGRRSGTRVNCWLCAVASSTSFALTNGYGGTGYSAPSTQYGVRPYFLTGKND